jgi:hypothetical protein
MLPSVPIRVPHHVLPTGSALQEDSMPESALREGPVRVGEKKGYAVWGPFPVAISRAI